MFPDSLEVSAKTHAGFEDVIKLLTENLLGCQRKYSIPMEQSNLVELARKNGTIEEEQWLENSVELVARIPGAYDENGNATTRTLGLLKKFEVNNEN